MADRLLDLAISIELQKFVDPLTLLIVIDKDSALMPGIQLDQFKSSAWHLVKRFAPIGGDIGDSVQQRRRPTQQRTRDRHSCIGPIKVGNTLPTV
jgi:hypothetical protein